MIKQRFNTEGWVISSGKALEIDTYLPDFVDLVILDSSEGEEDCYFVEKWVYDRYVSDPVTFGLNPVSGVDKIFNPSTDALITFRNDYKHNFLLCFN